MSYDLYLKPKEGEITQGQLEEYFLSRNNFQKEGDSFWYHNGDTAVCFSFNFSDFSQSEQHISGEGEPEPCSLHFNMNYFRPSFFVFEAEPEVTAVISKFNLEVCETPPSLISGEYDREKFLLSWNQGNHFSYLAIKRHDEENGEEKQYYTLPQKQLHEIWVWNKNKKRYQEKLGSEYYVPPIWAMIIDDELCTATLWPEGAPSFLPPTDKLIIANEDIKNKQEGGMSIVPWHEVEPIINGYSEKIQDGGYLINGYKTVPDDIKEFIAKLPTFSGNVKRIALDTILDFELWQQPVKES